MSQYIIIGVAAARRNAVDTAGDKSLESLEISHWTLLLSRIVPRINFNWLKNITQQRSVLQTIIFMELIILRTIIAIFGKSIFTGQGPE